MGKITEMDIYIGEKIREYRILKGLTQEELAPYLGVTFQQLQKYEKSTNRITASKLYIIAEVLEIPIESFLPQILSKESLLKHA
ncbi:MAG: helix-turn-helix transcriptional regulator [Pseudomonadota bacterium]